MISRTLRASRIILFSRIPPTPYSAAPIFPRALSTETRAASAISETPFIPQQPTLPTSSAVESPTPSAQTQPPRPPEHLPYFVGRNRINNLSVYEKRLRGGSMKKTLLKKGEGNLQALRFDVAQALGLTTKEVSVNNVTKHIEIKGHRREDIVRFLKNMGF